MKPAIRQEGLSHQTLKVWTSLPPTLRRLAEVIAVGAVYYASARFGLLLAFQGTNASPVWPPSGIALAAVLVLGYRIWPGIFMGAFLANAVVFAANQAAKTPEILLVSGSIAVGNTLEALLGAFLLRRLAVTDRILDHARGVFAFVLVAALMCLTSATIGPSSLCLGGIIPWSLYGTVALTWWLGDVTGALIVTPLLLVWRPGVNPPKVFWSAFEIACFLALLVSVAQLVFGPWLPTGTVHYALSFLMMPFLLWSAFRFGQRGLVVATVLVSGVAIWGTIHGCGPFVRERLNDSMLLLQSFVGISSVTGLVLAAVLMERHELGLERLKFVSLADSSVEFIGMCDLKFRPFYVNAAGLRQLGLGDLAAACRVKVQDYFFPEDQAYITNEFFPQVVRDGHAEVEIRFRHFQTGEAIWMLYNVFNLRDPQGAVIGWATVSRNIHDRKRAERALRAGQQQLQFVTDHAPVYIAHCDQDRRYKFVNEPYAKLIGRQQAEIVGKHPRELLGEEVYSQASPYMDAALAGRRVEFDLMLPPTMGGSRAIHVAYAPEFDGSGRVVGFLAAIRDITERKRAEQALRDSERALREGETRLRLAQQVAQIGTFEWNIQTGVNHWTPELEAMYGLSPGGFPGTQDAWERLVHEEDRPEAIRRIQQAIAKGAFEGEWRVVWPDGTIRWLAGRAFVFKDESGNPLRLIGVNIDITERKWAEQQIQGSLAQSQALTAHLATIREQERTRIAREIHDELGQALTGLKLELSWLRGRLGKIGPARDLDPLLDKSEEMSGLIDDTIQTVRRIVSELRPGVLDNLGLAAALEWQVQEFAKRSGIRCTVVLENAELDHDRATALFRIAQEALTNIARHAAADSVEVRLRRESDDWILEIVDNGRGIVDDEAGNARSFGLLGMRERAALVGGWVKLDSAPGRGTKVIVQVPHGQRKSA
jgi:PAS domain S-box-containing protein